MGFFTAIGSFLGFVNNNQTASTLAKDISNGVDMLVYTDEEEVIDRVKATTAATEAWLRMVELMKGSEVYRSVTRRALSLFFIFNIWCLIWLCVWIEVAATFGWFKGIVAVSQVENGLLLTPLTWSVLKIASVFELGWALCTIIVFYFGPQLAQILIGKKTK